MKKTSKKRATTTAPESSTSVILDALQSFRQDTAGRLERIESKLDALAQFQALAARLDKAEAEIEQLKGRAA